MSLREMSDLLPFVSAVLRDRAQLDSQAEIEQLRKELNFARSVEILHAPHAPQENGDDDDMDDGDDERDINNEVVMYAIGQFEDGDYDSSQSLWQVNLDQITTCRLADLTRCRICVGGGIQIESLDDDQTNRARIECLMDPDEFEDGDDSKAVQLYFDGPSSLSGLTIVVHGWPRAEWPAVAFRDDDDHVEVHPDDLFAHLEEVVATNHPDATVEFISLSLVESTVRGAIQRVLPPRRREEVESGRARYALGYYVRVEMQNRGIHDDTDPVPQYQDMMGALMELGISDFHGNEQVIAYLMDKYYHVSRDGMEAIIDVGLEEITRRAAAAAATGHGDETTEAGARDGNEDMDEDDD